MLVYLPDLQIVSLFQWNKVKVAISIISTPPKCNWNTDWIRGCIYIDTTNDKYATYKSAKDTKYKLYDRNTNIYFIHLRVVYLFCCNWKFALIQKFSIFSYNLMELFDFKKHFRCEVAWRCLSSWEAHYLWRWARTFTLRSGEINTRDTSHVWCGHILPEVQHPGHYLLQLFIYLLFHSKIRTKYSYVLAFLLLKSNMVPQMFKQSLDEFLLNC